MSAAGVVLSSWGFCAPNPVDKKPPYFSPPLYGSVSGITEPLVPSTPQPTVSWSASVSQGEGSPVSRVPFGGSGVPVFYLSCVPATIRPPVGRHRGVSWGTVLGTGGGAVLAASAWTPSGRPHRVPEPSQARFGEGGWGGSQCGHRAPVLGRGHDSAPQGKVAQLLDVNPRSGDCGTFILELEFLLCVLLIHSCPALPQPTRFQEAGPGSGVSLLARAICLSVPDLPVCRSQASVRR